MKEIVMEYGPGEPALVKIIFMVPDDDQRTEEDFYLVADTLSTQLIGPSHLDRIYETKLEWHKNLYKQLKNAQIKIEIGSFDGSGPTGQWQ